MNEQEIIKHIDDGANFYLDFFGDAEHMESVHNGIYRKICPKVGEQGIKFIYDIRLEDFSEKDAKAKISDVKALSLPVWWSLHSMKIQKLLHGKDYVPKPPTVGDEYYMALLPNEQPNFISSDIVVRQVVSREDFIIWAEIANQVFAGGYQDIHPTNHYHWCKNGRLIPYIAFYEDKPAAISSILNNNNIASLEFVATLEEYRRKGLARDASVVAVRNAFLCGAKIITLRAFHPANILYKSLGFKIYF